jgi:hypothetical protein
MEQKVYYLKILSIIEIILLPNFLVNRKGANVTIAETITKTTETTIDEALVASVHVTKVTHENESAA